MMNCTTPPLSDLPAEKATLLQSFKYDTIKRISFQIESALNGFAEKVIEGDISAKETEEQKIAEVLYELEKDIGRVLIEWCAKQGASAVIGMEVGGDGMTGQKKNELPQPDGAQLANHGKQRLRNQVQEAFIGAHVLQRAALFQEGWTVGSIMMSEGVHHTLNPSTRLETVAAVTGNLGLLFILMNGGNATLHQATKNIHCAAGILHRVDEMQKRKMALLTLSPQTLNGMGNFLNYSHSDCRQADEQCCFCHGQAPLLADDRNHAFRIPSYLASAIAVGSTEEVSSLVAAGEDLISTRIEYRRFEHFQRMQKTCDITYLMLAYMLGGFKMTEKLDSLLSATDEKKRKDRLLDFLGYDTTFYLEYDHKETQRLSILMMAAYMGNDPETIRALVEAGASLSLMNEHGSTALSLTLRAGHKEALKALVECGSKVKDAAFLSECQDALNHNNAVNLYLSDFLTDAEMLTQAGVATDWGVFGNMASTCFAGIGSSQSEEFEREELLDFFQNQGLITALQTKGNAGTSLFSDPLLGACWQRSKYNILLFLRCGFDVKVRCFYSGLTPILACVSGCPDDWDNRQSSDGVLESLLEAGADMNALTMNGNSALILAAYNQIGKQDVRFLLSNSSVSLEHTNKYGHSALHAASLAGIYCRIKVDDSTSALCDILNHAEKAVNLQDMYGNTALHYCTETDKKKILRSRATSSTSAMDSAGEDTGSYSSFPSLPSWCAILLVQGANPNITNKQGQTFYDLVSLELKQWILGSGQWDHMPPAVKKRLKLVTDQSLVRSLDLSACTKRGLRQQFQS